MTARALAHHLDRLQAVARAALASIFDRHEHVFLALSGGKDSIALAHLAEPWRARTTLLWSNPGYPLSHMPAFVRAFGERSRLVEVSPERPMLDDWREHGTPVDIALTEHLEGVDRGSPRMRPWPLCCSTNRMAPLVAYLARFGERCAFLNGQRRSDKGTTPSAMREIMSGNVETVMPLWAWSAPDVLGYVEAHSLPLPPHHDTFAGSFECRICPADIRPGRLRALEQFDPHAAAFVRATARISLGLAAAKAREIEAVLAETGTQEIHP